MIMTKKKYKNLQIDKTSNSVKRVLLSEEEMSHIMEMKSFLIFWMVEKKVKFGGNWRPHVRR